VQSAPAPQRSQKSTAPSMNLDAAQNGVWFGLRNGLYPSILAVLAGHPTPASLEAAVRASPWGTGGFGSPSYSGAHCPDQPRPATRQCDCVGLVWAAIAGEQ